MPELSLILTDFHPAATSTPDPPPPRLPALELLLARGTTAAALDWRSRLAQQWLPAAATLPPAAWLAATDQAPAVSSAAWIATPVHYFAGLDSVHLHPSGLLQLSPEEQATLVAEFAALYVDTSWRLQSVGGRDLVLSGPAATDGAGDPARFVGTRLQARLPSGEGAATLRRLSTEIEMWLYGHAINRQRAARGQLPVTGLWLWGGASTQDVQRARALAPPTLPLPQLYGEDTAVQALWRLGEGAAHALPAQYEAGLESQAHSVVLHPMSHGDSLTQAFMTLEQCWLEPALAALRARRLTGLRLISGERAQHLGRRHLLRLWRRAAPWWQPWQTVRA